jgi:hypothetical protein
LPNSIYAALTPFLIVEAGSITSLWFNRYLKFDHLATTFR